MPNRPNPLNPLTRLRQLPGRRAHAAYLAVIGVLTLCLLVVMGRCAGLMRHVAALDRYQADRAIVARLDWERSTRRAREAEQRAAALAKKNAFYEGMRLYVELDDPHRPGHRGFYPVNP